MGNGMNKIIPGLYLGNIRDSKDAEQLQEHNITHILSIHDNANPLREDIMYKCIHAADSPDQDLMPFFQECIEFIHSCSIAGISRSTTICAAYIMTITELSWRQTLQAIRANRSIANPNYGFKRQLQDFYNKHLTKSKERLQALYPDLNFTGEEHTYLMNLLSSRENTSRDDDDIPDVLNLYDHKARRLRQEASPSADNS
ncbi:dual specificity protein phosphatase 22 isoform X2 [Nematostella vectensis]|uniref:dual specificity protein phosphatase 22 isoform X2 n=1 Tax=Nematostella vectensis TaxID=45351 RepID=UPI00138FB610|nr:dual specificity protein phosphatase 22 isoform X2 [Nematostella vectensis]